MTHINPTLPVIGSPSWGVPLNDTLGVLVGGVNGLDDRVVTLEASDVTGMRFRGAWAAARAYAINDVVTYNSSDYVSLTAHTSGSSFTGVGANWALLARGAVSSTTPPTAPLVGDFWVDTN